MPTATLAHAGRPAEVSRTTNGADFVEQHLHHVVVQQRISRSPPTFRADSRHVNSVGSPSSVLRGIQMESRGDVTSLLPAWGEGGAG